MRRGHFAGIGEPNEAHIHDPWQDPQFGGEEPVPDDETGKDQRAPTVMTMETIRSLVRSVLEAKRTWIPASKNSPGRWIEEEDDDKDEPEKVPPSQRMGHMQRFERDVEAWIEMHATMPEYASLAVFQSTKLDDDDFTFDFMELNSLARSLWRGMMGEDDVIPPQGFVRNLKQNLIEFGLEFKPRAIQKLPRSGKNAHGTHPFANTGGGGSGFGFDGSAGGRGPGNVGGKYDWDPNDTKKNLPMGAAKEKKK